MIKLQILDNTGHTEILCADLEAVKSEIKERKLDDKFIFVDGQYTNVVTLNGITEVPREITITDRLIGG